MLELFIVIVALASMVVCHRMAKLRGGHPLFWSIMGVTFGPLAIPFLFLATRRAVP